MSTTLRTTALAGTVALLSFAGAGAALAQDAAAPPSVVQLCAATDIQTVDSLLAGAANSDLVGELAPLASLVVPADTDGIVLRGGLELDDVRSALDCGPTATPTPSPTPTAPADPLYADCAAAVAAGAAPIVLANGEPGYRPELDRDNDGIACEANEGPAPTTGAPTTTPRTTPAPSSGGFSQLDDVPTRAAETGGGPA